MSNVEALKKLAAVIIGGKKTAADIPGTSVAEVINYIAEHYPKTKG